MTNQRQSYIYNIALYILGFILFWEWLRPLEVVTDTANSIYFVIFTAICFLLYFFKLPFWLSIPLRFVFLLFILHRLFFEGSFFQLEWISILYGDIVLNTQALFNSQWLNMSDLVRSFLFLVLLWVMSYLIHYWLIQAKRIFGFYILTIVYLGILDTFTRYNAGDAIVRTIIIGFIMLGSLQMFRLKEREGVKVRSHWLLTLSVMVALSIFIGFQAPMTGPQWPDPVPFIKSAAKGQLFGNAVNKIGYGVDDSRLGGAFINDDTVVFTAEVNKAHYWRIESKDYYTGKGWEFTEDAPRVLIDKDNINLGILENVDKEKNMTAKINVANMGVNPHIAYPVDLRSIETDRGVQLLVDPFTGKLYTEKHGESVQLTSYEMTYDYPSFSTEALKLANDGDSAYIKEMYTQLPDNLPERVQQLAEEITKNKATRYEKAKAIEAYFSIEDYEYNTKDVAVPGEDQDYVDQFLFETKKGYCDNFSTSMVVLLRTLDIPARWVKGYTQGEYIDTINPYRDLYEVKNSNAHSWVEVYFPGIGWVPFEPTRGFSNLNTFTETTIPANSQTIQDSNQQVEQKEIGVKEKENEKNKDKNKSGNFLQDIQIPIKEIIIILVIAAVVIGLLKKYKTRWYPYWILMNVRIRKDKLSLKQIFETLFSLLKNKGLKIQSGETLREYAERVDHQLGTDEMKKMMEIYEKVLYSDSKSREEDMAAVHELWENLIKKILS